VLARNGAGLVLAATSDKARKIVGFGKCDEHLLAATLAPPQAIRADLRGSDTCEAGGIIARSSSPVLLLCRQLAKAGFDPRSRLEAYRGSTLCLTVASLAQGAALEVNTKGTGFIAARAVRAGAPIAPNGNSDPEPSDGGVK
jgi:hypothetical protein